MRALITVALLTSAVALTLLASASGAGDGPLPVLVSRQLAAAEGLRVGQIVRLSPSANGRDSRPFVVQGLIEPTPDPLRLGSIPRTVRLHLPDLIDLTRQPGAPGGAEHVEGLGIRLVDPADATAFSRDLAARMPGLTAQPAAGAAGQRGPFVVLQQFHLAIAIVTIFAATVFLLALSVMLVDERRPVVGVLRLIGVPSHRIVTQLFVEGLCIAGLGAVFGLLLAFGSAPIINRVFQWRYDTALVFVRITPEVAIKCVAIALPLGVAATVVTSYALLRRDGLRLARR